jgi:ABC-type lipoprotein export system ATPase subunit
MITKRRLAAASVRPPAASGDTNMELIRLEDIRKIYRLGEINVPVLKGVSLTIDQGELVALMGASGSGKTTLMNIFGCLDRPTSGRYWLDGQEVSRLSSDARALIRNKKIGFVFQSFNLLARTSALDNVMMPLAYTARGIGEREARKRALALLQRVGLGDRLHHCPSQLSGGQQQRVAVARALVNNPPLLFADEPTGNLDSKTSHEILRMFQQLCGEDGITVVLVTHDASVADFAERIIRIRDGLITDSVYDSLPDRYLYAESITACNSSWLANSA